MVTILDIEKFEKFIMSGNRQTGHFLVFLGVLQKSALGNVNVEVLWPNLVSNSNFYSDQNNDGLVTI